MSVISLYQCIYVTYMSVGLDERRSLPTSLNVSINMNGYTHHIRYCPQGPYGPLSLMSACVEYIVEKIPFLSGYSGHHLILENIIAKRPGNMWVSEEKRAYNAHILVIWGSGPWRHLDKWKKSAYTCLMCVVFWSASECHVIYIKCLLHFLKWLHDHCFRSLRMASSIFAKMRSHVSSSTTKVTTQSYPCSSLTFPTAPSAEPPVTMTSHPTNGSQGSQITGRDGDLYGAVAPHCSNDNLIFVGGYGMLVDW